MLRNVQVPLTRTPEYYGTSAFLFQSVLVLQYLVVVSCRAKPYTSWSILIIYLLERDIPITMVMAMSYLVRLLAIGRAE
jgi:hypothetical protein